MNSANFEILYREGPQKLKILSFSHLETSYFWIEIQFCWQKLYSIKALFFESDVSGSKQWQFKKLTTMKNKNFWNSIWRLNSSYFSNGKTTLSWIFCYKLTEFPVLCFLSFWGPSLYQIPNFDEFIWLELISTLRSTWFWRLIWNL